MKIPILLPNVFNYPFTYESHIDLKVGDYVLVPFGKSKITGVVWDEFEKNNNKKFQTKNIIKKLNVVPLKKKYNKIFELVCRVQSYPKRDGIKACFAKR